MAGELVGTDLGVLGFCICSIRAVDLRFVEGPGSSSSKCVLPRFSPVLGPVDRLDFGSTLSAFWVSRTLLPVLAFAVETSDGCDCPIGRLGKSEFLPGVGFKLRYV